MVCLGGGGGALVHLSSGGDLGPCCQIWCFYDLLFGWPGTFRAEKVSVLKP